MSDAPAGQSHDSLTTILGYRFDDPHLITEALLHTSIDPQQRGRARHGYQRLEFLGDRVIGLVAAQWLLGQHPKEGEGEIARRHAHLVGGPMLASIATEVGLGRFVALSASQEAAGGRDSPTIMADIMEAIVGALYLDGGIDAAQDFLVPLFDRHVDQTLAPPRDPKTALQEWAQARGLDLPDYRLIKQDGPAHQPHFEIEVSVAGQPTAMGAGTTKRQAEKEAASNLLTLVDASA
ncbi:MAG: ribonuclease III [Pseudomonadota bacterium]